MIGKTQSRFENIVQALIHHKAPAIAFVIANKMGPQQFIELKRFRDQGFLIGSHSYSHISLRNTPVKEYITDLSRADKILSPLMTTPKYFRYPYLAQGKWWWQRWPVFHYLKTNHYLIVPITVDSRDYEFDDEIDWTKVDVNSPAFKQIKQKYLDFIWAQTLKAERKDKWLRIAPEITSVSCAKVDTLLTRSDLKKAQVYRGPLSIFSDPNAPRGCSDLMQETEVISGAILSWSYHSKKQILLMHGNLLNSYFLDDVLDMYQKHGYRFISISDVIRAQKIKHHV